MTTTYQLVLTHLLRRLPGESADDRGASLVEYALLLALIAIVCVIAVEVLGTTTSGGYSSAASMLN